jgi:hypothetical protein
MAQILVRILARLSTEVTKDFRAFSQYLQTSASIGSLNTSQLPIPNLYSPFLIMGGQVSAAVETAPLN